MLGLAFAMIALGGNTMDNLPRILSDIPMLRKNSILQRLEQALMIDYNDQNVARWVA